MDVTQKLGKDLESINESSPREEVEVRIIDGAILFLGNLVVRVLKRSKKKGIAVSVLLSPVMIALGCRYNIPSLS